MYVWNGYDGDSETVNVLAKHTALKRWIATKIRWHRNIVSRESAVQSVTLLPISVMRLWTSSDKGPRVSTAIGKNHVSEWRREYCTWSSFSQTRPLQHFLPVAHFAKRRMLPVCEQHCHILLLLLLLLLMMMMLSLLLSLLLMLIMMIMLISILQKKRLSRIQSAVALHLTVSFHATKSTQ